MFVRVADAENNTRFENMPAPWDGYDMERLNALTPRTDGHWARVPESADGELFESPDVLEILATQLPDGATLQVGKSTEDRADVLRYFQGVFALLLVAVLAIGLLGGSWLANRSLRPVRELAGVLRSLSQTGKLDARVPTRQTGDELDELARLFNAQLERIESLVTRMRGALDDIAHDLRTPMTRVRGAAELALRSDASVEAYAEALADCLEESEQVLTMLNTLTDVSEAEAGAMRLERERVDLAALLESVVSLYEHVAEEKDVAIGTASPDGMLLQIDPRRMRQAFANLLDNAVKYTPAGGRIEIKARREKDQAVVSVNDTGIGIPSQEIPRIWDRLYRGEAAHSERGLGLGLTLVRAVVLAHGGSVEVRSQPGKGSQFIVRLPLNSAV